MTDIQQTTTPTPASGFGRWSEGWLAGCLILAAFTSCFAISATQILLGLSLAAWLARLVWLATLRRKLGAAGTRPPFLEVPTGLEGPLLALLIWAVAMVPLSGDRGQSLLFLRRFYLFSAVFLGAVTTAGGYRRQGMLLTALLVGAAGTGVYGLVQFGRLGGAFVDPWDGFLKDRVELLQGYMTAGGLMMMTALVALAFLLLVRSIRWRALLLAALLPMLATLLLTLTRSAWLGFAAGALVIFLLARPKLVPILLAGGLAVTLLVPGLFQERLVSAFDPDHIQNSQRLTMWRLGARMFGDHPWVGVGDRDLNELYWAYREAEVGGAVSREAYPTGPILVVGHLHNNLIQLAVIWGAPGLILALLLLVAIPVRLWRLWCRLRPPDRVDGAAEDLARGWILAGLGTWTGFMVAGLFEWYFGDADVSLLMWLITGAALGAGFRATMSVPVQSE